MNATEVKAVWLRATLTFDRNPLPNDDTRRQAVWQFYAEALSDVEVDTAEAFMQWWMSNGLWWPKPGDLRKWVFDQAGPDVFTVDGIWLELLAWLRSMYRRDNRIATSDEPWPPTPHDLRDLIEGYGGWHNLWNKRNDDFLRKEVKRSLESIALARRRSAEQPGSSMFKELEGRVVERIALEPASQLAIAP